MTTNYARPQTTPRELVRFWIELHEAAGLKPSLERIIRSATMLQIRVEYGLVWVTLAPTLVDTRKFKLEYGWAAAFAPTGWELELMAKDCQRALAWGQSTGFKVMAKLDLPEAALALREEMRILYALKPALNDSGRHQCLHEWLEQSPR